VASLGIYIISVDRRCPWRHSSRAVFGATKSHNRPTDHATLHGLAPAAGAIALTPIFSACRQR